jgi:beta-N-acetylhexosaminidase
VEERSEVTDGFMTQEQRTFGSNPTKVAKAACSFAKALAREHVAYTLKHFPGLGDAIATTDAQPVAVTESAASIYDDDAAYRRCGHGKLAAVMISSASYPNLTGSAPAVLSPLTYRKVIEQDRINALLISDSFESGAIQNLQSPALHALNAGLDMVMYPDYESVALSAYSTLVNDAEHRLLPVQRLDAAVNKVLELKRNLGLG